MNNTLETGNPDAASHRIYWRSRRGMLELELLLLPFARLRYGELDPVDQTAYAQLLSNEDWDIFDWLQGRAEAPDPELRRIVRSIQAFNAADAGR